MAKWWKGLALCLGWLGLTALAEAQFPPASGAPVYPVMAPGANGNGQATASDQNGAPQPPMGMMPIPVVPCPPPPAVPLGGPGGPDNAFTECDIPCCPPSRCHVNMEYWRVWLNKPSLPILLTSGSINDTIPAALGQPGTQVVIDGVQGGGYFRNGGQLAVGYDLDEMQIFTLEANYFLLESGNPNQSIESDGQPGSAVLGRPFVNILQNREDADPVALTNIMAGRIQFNEPYRLQGGELLLHSCMAESRSYGMRWSCLTGGRYLFFEEALEIHEELTDLPGLGVAGNSYFLHEHFSTWNRFYGGTLGAEVECCHGPVSLLLSGKCSLGNLQQTVNIGSFTQIRDAAGNEVAGANTALLVGPGNAGQFTHNHLIVVPEGMAKIAVTFNEHVTISAGYKFLLIPDVVRPGNQIDRTVNIQTVPATPFVPLRPGPPSLATSDLTVHGLTLGLQLNF